MRSDAGDDDGIAGWELRASSGTSSGRLRRLKRRLLWLLKHSLNRLTSRAARAGIGPFSLVRHVGRKSGRVYETPIIVAAVDGGFVCELTYGTDVDWYRNVQAAGGCTLLVKRVEHRIDGVSDYPTEDGRRAFGAFKGTVLKVLRRREFRLLVEAK